MPLPIKPTEPIEGKDAEEFLRKMKEVDDNPGQDELKFETPDIKPKGSLPTWLKKIWEKGE